MDNPDNAETRRLQLDLFRAKSTRQKIHPLEAALLCVVAAHLVFLPWALGGMRSWAQEVSLGLSVVSLVLSLWPRDHPATAGGRAAFRLHTWPKLLRFPIFWLGLALLAYCTIGALNPAWEYQTDGKVFWMRAIPHRPWLPTGVIAPFEKWNPWRTLIIYASGWLTVCAIWVAFTRRRTLQFLLATLAFNGVALAVLGIAQRLSKASKILWSITSSNDSFFATFIYKNHGGAYLDLILAVTCGLAGWYFLRGVRRLEKSNPSGVLAFLATVIAISVLISFARGATIVMFGFLSVCIAAFVVQQFKIPKVQRRPIIAIAMVLMFGYFLKTGLEALHSGEAWDRLRRGITREDASLESRERATAAALKMLGDNWAHGVGAGSFRYIFTIYQHRDPELVQAGFWEHAHNDIVEIPIELGAVGIVLIASGFLYWAVTLLRSCFWQEPLSTCIVGGLLLILIYAWWDFPFQCPAVSITWCALWPIAAMWARFEEAGARG